MKRLYFVVEGFTEREFVNNTLLPYFVSKEIYDVRAVEITTSKGHKGGFVNYEHLKNDVDNFLKSEKDIIVTTFVDFFKIPTSVPNYHQLVTKSNIDDKLELLESGMFKSINDYRFLPYIQKHEFEALLFSAKKGFELMYDDNHILEELNAVIDQYDNPEDINTRPEFAPSKRLRNILDSRGEKYDKVAEGNLIAEELGIELIMSKCPRFRIWIEKLEALVKS